MAKIRAFRGVRFDLDSVEDEELVVSPPYDVIDQKLQQVLYDKHDHNIIRIIQGKTSPGDGESENVYTRARSTYRNWLKEGVLKVDDSPALYVYTQTFDVPAPNGTQRKSRQGLVALVEIQKLGEGGIYPHEHTMPGPKKDRLELMRHTEAAFGQIFSLFSDPDFHVRSLLEPYVRSPPLFQFDDADGVNHAFWRVDDPKTVDRVCAFIETCDLFIADGHHRYETAVNYRDERLATGGRQTAGYCYRMQTLVNLDDPEGMTINPIHRVVTNVSPDDLTKLRQRLGDFFEMEDLPFGDVDKVTDEIASRAEADRPCFGALLGTPDIATLLKLRSDVDLTSLDCDGHSEAWRLLDSGLLQLVLGDILGLDTETLIKGEKVRFIKVETEVRQAVHDDPQNVGFYLNPVVLKQLRDVVLAGERMPPKSTFFYPKVFTGLVIQDFDKS